jgi:ADP-heptose:LPS heptosyltransferase
MWFKRPASKVTSFTKSVLIILPRQLGDVLVSTNLPVLIKQYTNVSQVIWLAHPMAKQILENASQIDEIWYHPVAPRWKGNPFKWFRDVWNYVVDEISFCQKLRSQHKFFGVLDIMSTPHSLLWALCSHSEHRVGIHKKNLRSHFYHHKIPIDQLKQGFVGADRMRFLEPLGVPFLPNLESLKPQFIPKSAPRQRAHELVLEWRKVTKCKTFVMLSITSRRENRKWPRSHYLSLALRILKETPDVHVVWLWGPGEEAEVFEMHREFRAQASSFQHRSLFPPLLSLAEIAALCPFSLGFVGGSNGLAHICVAGGAKSVQIHGPTVSYHWTFPDPSRHMAVTRREGCVACDKNVCAIGTRECLLDLPVENVFKAVQELLLGRAN